MLSYKINNDDTRKFINILKESQLYWDKINSFSPEQKQFVRKSSMISNIGASTRIENAILTDVEIDWIDTEISSGSNNSYKAKEKDIKDKLTKDKERSIEEVAGYREGLQIINNSSKDFFPLKESDIKGLHREIMKYYSDAKHHAGNYKTQINSVVETNNVIGEKRTILKTADPGIETETSMGDLVSWFNESLPEDPWCIPTAVEFIFRFLAIHPFQDGNGRLSRLLFQLILMNSEERHLAEIIPYIALDRSLEKTRPEYYLVLQKCSGGIFDADPTVYEYMFFLNYMIKRIEESLPNINFYVSKYEKYKSLTETDHKILQAFRGKPEQYMQTKDLVESLKIPRRTIIYSINKLLSAEFIQSTGISAGKKYKLAF